MQDLIKFGRLVSGKDFKMIVRQNPFSWHIFVKNQQTFYDSAKPVTYIILLIKISLLSNLCINDTEGNLKMCRLILAVTIFVDYF